MISENVCKYVPLETPDDKIRTINFVLETKPQVKEKMRLDAFFTVHFVLDGKGKMYKTSGVYELNKNSVFFTLPSEGYSIESDENFRYMYITYIGLRAVKLNQRLKIDFQNCVFDNCEEMAPLMEYFFDIAQDKNLATISESALLYIYAVLEKNSDISGENPNGSESTVEKMKKYINDNFGDCELSLEKISENFSYNKNYVSALFKKKTGVTISKYINSIRVQNACTLMKNNLTCIKDISNMCGIEDSLYFSRVFKKIMGISPKEFILQNTQK